MNQFKFKLDRYNWLSQKLLALHQYEEIRHVRNYMVRLSGSRALKSEHMSYLYALALMKTSDQLNEVVNSLQSLNYDKNSQYFLALCQCLLYMGNFDSVVALCKQVMNKEIDTFNSRLATTSAETETTTGGEEEEEAATDKEDLLGSEEELGEGKELSRRKLELADFMSSESAEFEKILASINQNRLINEPKLWFVFGLALEYQGNYNQALLALKIAWKLSSGGSAGQNIHTSQPPTQSGSDSDQAYRFTITSNYYLPHVKYAEACIKYQNDFKTATQVFAMSSLVCPQNYVITPTLALLISVHNKSFSSSAQNSNRAVKIIAKLESYFASNRNPALGYNNLALKCKEKFRQQTGSVNNLMFDHNSYGTNSLEISGDANRVNLNFQLTKVHVTINSLIQEYNNKLPLSTQKLPNDRYQLELVEQIDRLIESMRNTDSSCWNSASLWNNLGVCFLIKRRYIACLSCMLKAHSINFLDWRINYNLAIASAHVGLTTKAFTSLLQAKNFHPSSTKHASGRINGDYNENSISPIINSLQAICYMLLGEVDESRRLFIETIRPQKKLTLSGVPIASLVNYLIFLHRNPEDNEQYAKLKLHLLDLLEQAWLQRHQNDPQFNVHLLDVANRIAEETFQSTDLSLTKKTFAWTKAQTSVSLN